MFGSTQIRTMALAVSLSAASTTALARAQPPAHEDVGLPTTPPPLESSGPLDEDATTPQPSESAGVAVFVGLLGPLGLALGGVSTAVGVTSIEAPRLHPLAPAVEPRQTGAWP